MAKNRKGLIAAGALIVIAAAAYALLFGKLFPFSPVLVGFERTDLRNAVVYAQKGYDFGDLGWIDSAFAGLEEFHGLRFASRPRIILFGSDRTYAMRSISRARLCAFYNGTIVVSPRASREDREGLISLRVYMTHELSHILLFQNMGLPASLRYPKWLLEGIATLAADQMGATFYPTRDETVRLISLGNWMPPDVFGTRAEDGIRIDAENRMPFIYCEFALIVDDLIHRFGRDRFHRFMTGLTFWSSHDRLFRDVFGMSFGDYISEFREKVAGSIR